jgi:hypothetical protein
MIEGVAVRLDAVELSVSVVVGDRDQIEHEAALRGSFARFLPQASFRVFQGIGHLQPAALANACRRIATALGFRGHRRPNSDGLRLTVFEQRAGEADFSNTVCVLDSARPLIYNRPDGYLMPVSWEEGDLSIGERCSTQPNASFHETVLRA